MKPWAISSALCVSLALGGACQDPPVRTVGPVDAVDAASETTNTPPGPLVFHLEPAEARTTDPITVIVDEQPIDPDSGPEELEVRVVWLRDDVETPHSGLVLPPEMIQRGEEWTAVVSAWDGADPGPSSQASITILNSPPVLESVQVTPASPGVDSLLKCEAGTRADADDDAVSVQISWVNGDALIEGADTGALSPPLESGASYRCGGTPFDGQEEGETVWSNIVVPVAEITEEAILLVQPKALDLGVALPGEENQAILTVHNIGVADLQISDGVLGGDEGFGFVDELPVVLSPGSSTEITVTFATDQPGLHKGSLTLNSNAFNPNEGVIQLLGVGASPCLLTSPKSLDFGGAYVASHHDLPLTLLSCGALPVTIDDISLTAPQGSPFTLDLAPGPGPLPWTLEPGVEQLIKVRFEPTASSPTNDEGNPIPEEANVGITVAGSGDELTVPVSGFGSDAGCPTPVIHVEEGHAVGPFTLLHLDGLGSIAPGGLPSIFSWAVDRPDGAPEASFDPAANVPEVTYPVEALGVYVFTLKVFDQVDDDVISGCTTASWKVTVKEAIPLIIELTWDTPGDSDQGDEGPGEGADMDLHMHRGGGTNPDYDGDGVPDTWFDPVLDVYWLDTSPPWGAAGPDDDPVLALQDPDGLGPERIEHPLPTVGDTYTIGVHAWSDYGFGPSVATVRVYHFEELVAESTDVVLNGGDLWEVGEVTWPQGALVPSVGQGGGPDVTPGYPNPFQ